MKKPTKHNFGETLSFARQQLRGNWGIAIGAFILSILVSSAAGIIPFGNLIIAGPLAVGSSIISLNILRNRPVEISQLFDGFKHFANPLIAYILTIIAVLIGSLLFIIPGIIVGLGLSMTNFILADKPEMSGVDAMKKSWELMDGYKVTLLAWGILFLLMFIVIVPFTLGIGLFWLIPVFSEMMASFYEQILAEKYPDMDNNDDAILDHLITE